MNIIDDLKELGFETAHQRAKEKLDLKAKMTIAYENYRFVTPEIFDRFNEALKKKTIKKTGKNKWGDIETYEKLVFIPVNLYGEIPPQEVLIKMKEAKLRGCFDDFEVAKVETVEIRPDPIIFGLIHGCVDKFFVAQWDNDVKIEDILMKNEG